jgi:thioredoxin 1
MASVLESVAGETKGRAVIGLVMVSDGHLVQAFGIDKIPAVFIVRNAEIVDSFVGVRPKAEIHKILKEKGA